MKRLVANSFLRTVLFLVWSTTAWAQATAEINGRVTDESNAVLPGVTDTATQTDTGLTRTVVTDGTGTWGNPGTNFGAGTVGLIQSQSGAPRIMQFGMKFGF
jgi:hypothetical protein